MYTVQSPSPLHRYQRLSGYLEGDYPGEWRVYLWQVLEGDLCGETAMTAVKNAISSRRCDVIKQLVELGCDINMADSDGW